jgi:hypothetical protein
MWMSAANNRLFRKTARHTREAVDPQHNSLFNTIAWTHAALDWVPRVTSTHGVMGRIGGGRASRLEPVPKGNPREPHRALLRARHNAARACHGRKLLARRRRRFHRGWRPRRRSRPGRASSTPSGWGRRFRRGGCDGGAARSRSCAPTAPMWTHTTSDSSGRESHRSAPHVD